MKISSIEDHLCTCPWTIGGMGYPICTGKCKRKIKFNMKIGVLLRLQSFWVGVHYSKYNKRLCVNLLPCCTIYIGNAPNLKLM